jgi:hypothetical protein
MPGPGDCDFPTFDDAIQEQVKVWEQEAGTQSIENAEIPTDEAVQHALCVLFDAGKIEPFANYFPPLIRVSAATIYLGRRDVRERFIVLYERRLKGSGVGMDEGDLWIETYKAVLYRLADPNPKLKPVANLERFFFRTARNLFMKAIRHSKAEKRALAEVRRRRLSAAREQTWLRRLEVRDELLMYIAEKRRGIAPDEAVLRGFALAVLLLIENPGLSHSDCLRRVAERADGVNTVVPARSTFSRWLAELAARLRRSGKDVV